MALAAVESNPAATKFLDGIFSCFFFSVVASFMLTVQLVSFFLVNCVNSEIRKFVLMVGFVFWWVSI